MTNAEYERLLSVARIHGEQHGVGAELVLEDGAATDTRPAGERLFLKVFRFIEGKLPLEYSKGSGYRTDLPDLELRIKRDIESAAQHLYEAR